MRSLSMTKRVCALLLVFTALGAVVGTSAPAEAQTPPASVAFWTRNRSVSFTSHFTYCNNIQYNAASSVQGVSRGEARSVRDSWFTCNGAGKEIVGDLFVHGSYSSDGVAVARHELRVRVNWGGGTVWCGSAWVNLEGLGTQVNGPFPLTWGQVRAESGWVSLDCQHQGTVRVYFSLQRGLST